MESHQMSTTESAVEYSANLNLYLQHFYEKTVNINNVLKVNEDDSIYKVEQLLTEREQITKQYDQLKAEYQGLTKLIAEEAGISAETDTLSALPKEHPLCSLQAARERLLHTIQELDNENKKIVWVQYNEQKHKIQHVNEGKKMHDAYYNKASSNNGAYFDTRK